MDRRTLAGGRCPLAALLRRSMLKAAPTIYPGVHGGDRIDGATWARRSGGLGRARRGGDRPSAGDAGRHRDAEARRLGGGRGDRRQRGAGLRRADLLRRRRRLLRAAVGPQDPQGAGPQRLGPQPQGPDARRDSAGAPTPRGCINSYGAVSVSVPGAVDAWWTLHQRYGKLPWKELFAAGDPPRRGGRADHPERRLLRRRNSQRIFTKPEHRHRGDRELQAASGRRTARRRARARCSAIPSSPAPTA